MTVMMNAPPTPAPRPRLLTTAEAAAIINITPRQLQRYWRRWGLAPIKVCGELRFPEDELSEWLETRRAA